MTVKRSTIEDRIARLKEAKLVVDDDIGPLGRERIEALSDQEFEQLLGVLPKLSTPGRGPTVRYEYANGFQAHH